jgi:hypothetical protein
VDAVLDEIVEQPRSVRRKAENARRLWKERFDPAVAVRPLVEIVESLAGR